MNKEVEVIASEIEDASYEQKRKKVKEASDFFKKISVDMSNFKFDRDEANER